MNTLTYCQCSFCRALGCRKTKDFVLGVSCKFCNGPMHSITTNEYDRKLHYTATPHEEGLLPDRCTVPSYPIARDDGLSGKPGTDVLDEREEQ